MLLQVCLYVQEIFSPGYYLDNAESDEKLQKNTVIMICFAVTVILGLISRKGIKAKESE